MDAREKTFDLQRAAEGHGFRLSFDDAQTLRRAELTLHRWSEGECGDVAGNLIERDDETGKPYISSEWGARWGLRARTRRPIPDRERGALRRVADVCERLGLHFYHQGDPRGCSLYVDNEPIPNNNYTRAIACVR